MACDPYRSSVVLALHMDGTNGSTTFTDSSPSAKTVTANGNAQISTAQSKFGGASGLFDGSGDRLTLAHDASLSFGAVGTDFTIELFIRPTAFAAQQNIVNKQATLASATGYLLALSASGAPSFYAGDSTNGWDVSLVSGTNLSTATWYHLAVTRAGNTYRLFVDGTQVATTTSSITIHDNANSLFIGTNTDGSTSSVNGYIDDLRITKGVARYTANFTAPAAAFPGNQCVISGVVGSPGNYVERVVRAYRRDTGAFVGQAQSNPTTGAYSIDAQHNGECFAIVHDSASISSGAPVGGSFNAVIYDRITPA